MKISCLMPTYGRPTLVQNAIACFEAQDYPADRRRLLILDDAGQLAPHHGEGWSVWSMPLRMETLTAKYAKLGELDEGWADVYAIWDDDDIYLPWHLSAHAIALRDSRWSHPTKVWSLYAGQPALEPAEGRFWSSAAVRVEFLGSLGGFIQSARADFDQVNLRAWRRFGGAPGRPEPPSFVYGWGRSKHSSLAMITPDNTDWYRRHEADERGRITRLTAKMDVQTKTIFASLAPGANRSACSAATTRPEIPVDPYDVVRTLLSYRDANDPLIACRDVRPILVHCRRAQGPEFWMGLTEEAEYHGVAPLLEPIISAFAQDDPETVPDDVRWAFVALAHRHRRAAFAREACVDNLLEAFATVGIPVILLKGAALSHLIYSAPKLRPMVDVDLLINPADVERAVITVRNLGYSFASSHGSRFAGRFHHLPVASILAFGFRVSLEIHVDAFSPDAPGSLTFATLAAAPRPFQRGTGPRGLALGHTDMLRHLARHAFEPARRVRLIHLYDLCRYREVFSDEIDERELQRRHPQVIVALQLASKVFVVRRPANSGVAGFEMIPSGVGYGMMPLSEIANMRFATKLTALFRPSAWWLHGFYGIPLEDSLLVCRTLRHPLTLGRWFARRLTAAIVRQQTVLQRVSNDVVKRPND